ncbi:AKAP5 protein, partial [Polypterus senegalus]
MPRVPAHLRERALGMLQGGMRTADVARAINCHVRTVRRLRQRYRETGRTADHPRSGRPRVTTPAQNRYIRISHLRDSFEDVTKKDGTISLAAGEQIHHIQDVLKCPIMMESDRDSTAALLPSGCSQSHPYASRVCIKESKHFEEQDLHTEHGSVDSLTLKPTQKISGDKCSTSLEILKSSMVADSATTKIWHLGNGARQCLLKEGQQAQFNLLPAVNMVKNFEEKKEDCHQPHESVLDILACELPVENLRNQYTSRQKGEGHANECGIVSSSDLMEQKYPNSFKSIIYVEAEKEVQSDDCFNVHCICDPPTEGGDFSGHHVYTSQSETTCQGKCNTSFELWQNSDEKSVSQHLNDGAQEDELSKMKSMDTLCLSLVGETGGACSYVELKKAILGQPAEESIGVLLKGTKELAIEEYEMTTVEVSKQLTLEKSQWLTAEELKETVLEESKETTVEGSKEETIKESKETAVVASEETTVEVSKEVTLDWSEEPNVEKSKETAFVGSEETTVEVSKEVTLEWSKQATAEEANETVFEGSGDTTVEVSKEVTMIGEEETASESENQNAEPFSYSYLEKTDWPTKRGVWGARSVCTQSFIKHSVEEEYGRLTREQGHHFLDQLRKIYLRNSSSFYLLDSGLLVSQAEMENFNDKVLVKMQDDVKLALTPTLCGDYRYQLYIVKHLYDSWYRGIDKVTKETILMKRQDGGGTCQGRPECFRCKRQHFHHTRKCCRKDVIGHLEHIRAGIRGAAFLQSGSLSREWEQDKVPRRRQAAKD